jgi:hypothetical protein
MASVAVTEMFPVARQEPEEVHDENEEKQRETVRHERIAVASHVWQDDLVAHVEHHRFNRVRQSLRRPARSGVACLAARGADEQHQAGRGGKQHHHHVLGG